jgi:sugar phosphate isomerase/epimerase
VKPSISQATTLPASFADDLDACADAGCPAVEVWLTKLEKHLESHPPESVRDHLTRRNLTLVAASYQGGLLVSQGEQRRAHLDHFRRRLELCQAFGIPTLVVVADFLQPPDGQAIERAIVSLRQAAQWAEGFGVRLAVEFRGTSAFCSCLETAVALVGQCGEANVGICLDVFHYFKGPSKHEDLALLTADNLFLVQVSDVAGVPRELATDSDRVLPGDGDFHLAPIVARLREIGYAGFVSLELFNPTLWQIKPAQVAEIGMASLRRFLE